MQLTEGFSQRHLAMAVRTHIAGHLLDTWPCFREHGQAPGLRSRHMPARSMLELTGTLLARVARGLISVHSALDKHTLFNKHTLAR